MDLEAPRGLRSPENVYIFETMRGRVTLHNHDSLSRATVQLTRCWATPFADPTDGFNLINNL